MAATRTLLVIWLALLALLGSTVAASYLFTGAASIAAGMGIATVKMALIYWFFMHLKEEGGTVRLMAIGAIAWLAIPLILIAGDYVMR